MHLDGTFTVNRAQTDVYAFLTDPATVSQHMPDVKNVIIDDADHFTVTARVGISHNQRRRCDEAGDQGPAAADQHDRRGEGHRVGQRRGYGHELHARTCRGRGDHRPLAGRRHHLRKAGGVWPSGPPGSDRPEEHRHVHRRNSERPAVERRRGQSLNRRARGMSRPGSSGVVSTSPASRECSAGRPKRSPSRR